MKSARDNLVIALWIALLVLALIATLILIIYGGFALEYLLVNLHDITSCVKVSS